MSDMPAVSVVIPTRNRATLLRETLQSLREQTTDDFETVVIDDGSTDDTAEVASAFDVRFVPLPKGRRGASAGRNVGVARTTGRYVVFLDSDDLLAPTCLADRIQLMDDRTDLDFAVSQCGLFRDTPGDSTMVWNRFNDGDDLDRYLSRDPVWQTTAPTWRRESLATIGPWDEQALSGQDWEMSTRAIAVGLRYETFEKVVDCHWRLPSGSRDSIGKSAAVGEKAAHARSWAGTVERVWRAVDAAGLMNQHRRDLVAGLMWHACRRLADAASFGEARRFWRKVHRDFGLINEQQFAEGWLYHRSGKIAWFNRLKEDRVATGWPRHFRRAVEGSRTHCRVRSTGTPPAVSVLLPAYNANRYIEEAVESILLQTFRDFELLIVDDGSTDGTAEKLERLAERDVRVQLVRRPRGRGKGYVQGLIEMAERARGEFLARMDADDVARPERFELQIDRLRSDADLVLVGGQVRWVDPYGLDLESSQYPTTHNAIDAELLAGRGGVIPHPGSLFRKSAYEQVGGYRNGFQPSEDLDLWLRLAEVGRVANVDEVILDYRQHFASVTRSRRDEQLRVKPRIIAEACQRRGLPAPEEASLDQWEPAPPDQLLYRWGWQAIKERHLEAARGHAWSLVRRRPFDRDAWHLAACAVRGR